MRDRARLRLRKKVAFTAPSPTANQKLPFSPHALVCHRDLLLTICSAKSLNLAMNEALAWKFHDDGSLNEWDKNLLLTHFPGCRIIERKEADLFYERNKEKYPHLVEMRRTHVMLLKLADLYAFSDRETILYVDSDVLFLRKPDFLMNRLCADRGANYFNKDVAPAYLVHPTILKELTGVQPPERINAGLSILNRDDISLDKISKVLAQLEFSKRTDWLCYDHLIEQTTVALLAASSPNGICHLPSEYDVSFDMPIEQSVSRHYVGVIRHRFEMEGLNFLIHKMSFSGRWQTFSHQNQIRT